MDVNNERLKTLSDRVDHAFSALIKDPDSPELNFAYENAKNDLKHCITSMRKNLESHHYSPRR